jgi:hypothetical protein
MLSFLLYTVELVRPVHLAAMDSKETIPLVQEVMPQPLLAVVAAVEVQQQQRQQFLDLVVAPGHM